VNGSGSDRGLDLALALFAALAGLSLVVWLAGQLSGAVFGAGWPPGHITNAGTVLLALPQHLDDPARAWPRAAQTSLPGPIGFYSMLGLVLGTIIVGVVVVTARVRDAFAPGPRSPRGGRNHRSSRWARPRDLRRLLVRRATPGRLILGRIGSRLVATEDATR
jgi:hypothetical protein